MAYKNTVKDYSQMIGFLTRDKTTDVPGSMAHGLRTGLYDGGRAGFDNGGQTMVEQAKELGISKSALRKPFAPEIEEKIIKLHQVDKMGAEAIANELGLPRSSVGKRITALKKEGKIKDVPYAERKAAIDQRGEFFGKPAAEKFQKIREVRDIDRTTRYRVGPEAGQLKYDIPKNAKFKIDFKTAGGLTSDIPENLQGLQYYTTKKQAEKALAKRKKLKLKADVDPDEVRRSANKKKYDLVKEVSNNNIEELLTDFKTGQPLEQAHRLSLQQVKKTGELYNVMNLGLDFDDPDFVQINNQAVKPYENKLKQLYTEQNKLYKKASKLKNIPKELRKQIEFNNKKISTVVDLSGGRVQGLQLDEFTLKPKVTGTNYANVLGFGLYDKPVKELTDIDRAGIGAVMQGQIENEKKTAGKTAQKLFSNQKLLKNIDSLATSSEGIKLGANPFFDPSLMGKVIGDLGKGINVGLGPTGILALNTALGTDPRESLDRVGLGVEAAMAKPLVSGATSVTDKIKNPMLRKIAERAALAGMSPAMAMKVARVASPLGIASLAGEGLYQVGKLGYEDQQRFNALSPEEQAAERAEQEKFAFDIEGS